MPILTPAQQRAFDFAIATARAGHAMAIIASSGNGKTTLMRAIMEELGGRRIGAADFQAAASAHHPLAIEDALFETIDEALNDNPVVLVDDLDLVTRVVEGCHSYPRGGFVQVALNALSERAATSDRIIIVAASMPTHGIVSFGQRIVVEEFGIEDYRTVCAAYLTPEQHAAVDFAKVHRFARRMTARQLRRACEGVRARLKEAGGEITDVFIEYLKQAQLVSNVDLGEVQTVKLEDLKGLDDVLRALEANVILPLEHSELATEFSLRPKRGVLLVGPPGTGKTTIGRALAHRLRGKFFLVDGTVIAGTPMFYQQLHGVFEAAMRNAPAVVFIDDSDVIFEGQDPGLYRYLLTMLDGLESESAGGVCLILTAMDVGSLPPALVRSGRIELWLETRLPDEEARTALLHDLCKQLPDSVGAVDVDALARATTDLSGADLKRVVDDGKLLYAFDRAHARAGRPILEYFLEALETVRANKLRYAQAEASARMRNPSRPSHFHVPFMPSISEGAMEGETHFVRVSGVSFDGMSG
jgi:ATP-dependent 26S proteasome regulatory subunit